MTSTLACKLLDETGPQILVLLKTRDILSSSTKKILITTKPMYDCKRILLVLAIGICQWQCRPGFCIFDSEEQQSFKLPSSCNPSFLIILNGVFTDNMPYSMIYSIYFKQAVGECNV